MGVTSMYVCIKYMFWMDRVELTGDRTRPLGSGLPVRDLTDREVGMDFQAMRCVGNIDDRFSL